ncbi:O-acetylhomoserine aminocarboxypropyltransferase/cysteine synthase family protein [Brachybacterium sp. ACRRE]|uniref:O-acetylhomoserine aminocarboxypropyltransferase/cysteine synthase family protein n=1 Tax=Brachybacterium sp. ACRRE TaxID=2918184 RepID=UPI001EF3106E|nr:aminotransferase class I/II-fold pyridoxal phosphate-dependent enzyme [Brachybacterium sp. ACRRE]MCG7309170.1 aminotransferase class I/II-fold pyridoxal phosphate-dependent enzyme [Brachybacterium sp. ACRRE]
MSTTSVHAGWDARDAHGSLVPPIYATSAYAHSGHASLKALFARESEGFAYSRSGNPTTAVLEQRIAALEGGIGAIAVASGQAATTIALCALLEPGTHVVASSRLYGGTTEFLGDTLVDLQVSWSAVDPWDVDAWRTAIRPETRVVLLESIANPGAELADLDAISAIAHEHGAVVVVDSTLASPALYRPGEHGADVVVHSATKYLAGHGTTIAGLIVDTGSFDPRRCPERWPRLTTPNERFHVTFADEYEDGGSGLLGFARTKYVTDFGATLPAQSARDVLVGIETLDLRLERISAHAEHIARSLQGAEGIVRVNHPSAPGRADAHLAARDFPRGTSGVFSIDLEGGEAAAAAFCDALSVFTLAVNIGDVRSLVCHPATTTHSHLSMEQRAACGVGEGTVRLSIGLEDVDDLLSDLQRGLAAARTARDAEPGDAEPGGAERGEVEPGDAAPTDVPDRASVLSGAGASRSRTA